jgi:hypothetical protein
VVSIIPSSSEREIAHVLNAAVLLSVVANCRGI